jgi:pilus assembly protein CpaB
MKARGLVLIVAILLAAAATAAVFLYTQGVKKEASPSSATMVTVIVAKEDIPAGTNLDNLISSGGFTTLRIPEDAVVQGAVTDLAQLRGRRTSTFILKGEQISTARLQGSTQPTGGVLGIPAGYVAVTVALQQQKVPGQVLQAGDHVTVYATFSNVSLVSGTAIEQLMNGQVPTSTQGRVDVGDFTVDLVPDVQVLRVTGQSGSDSQANQSVYVTLALLPKDASNVVFAQERGSVWLGLLAPGEKGKPLPPVSYLSALRALTRGGG